MEPNASAGRALADAAGAEYVLSEKANVSMPFKLVRDGDELELGNVVLKVLHPPGHTLLRELWGATEDLRRMARAIRRVSATSARQR